MSRLLSCLALSAVAAATSHLAAAQAPTAHTVTLDPGLYEYTHVILMGGRAMTSEADTYCVREGENSRSLDELVDSLAGDGECKLTNVSMTGSTGRADLFCTNTDLGMDISGTLEAEYGADYYNVDAQAKLGPLPVQVETKLRRSGACPAE